MAVDVSAGLGFMRTFLRKEDNSAGACDGVAPEACLDFNRTFERSGVVSSRGEAVCAEELAATGTDVSGFLDFKRTLERSGVVFFVSSGVVAAD